MHIDCGKEERKTQSASTAGPIGEKKATHLHVRSLDPGGGLPHAILRFLQKKHASVSGFLGVSSMSGGLREGIEIGVGCIECWRPKCGCECCTGEGSMSWGALPNGFELLW